MEARTTVVEATPVTLKVARFYESEVPDKLYDVFVQSLIFPRFADANSHSDIEVDPVMEAFDNDLEKNSTIPAAGSSAFKRTNPDSTRPENPQLMKVLEELSCEILRSSSQKSLRIDSETYEANTTVICSTATTFRFSSTTTRLLPKKKSSHDVSFQYPVFANDSEEMQRITCDNAPLFLTLLFGNEALVSRDDCNAHFTTMSSPLVNNRFYSSRNSDLYKEHMLQGAGKKADETVPLTSLFYGVTAKDDSSPGGGRAELCDVYSSAIHSTCWNTKARPVKFDDLKLAYKALFGSDFDENSLAPPPDNYFEENDKCTWFIYNMLMMAGKVYNNFLTLESQCQLFSTLLRVLVGQGRVEAIEKQYNVELYVRLPHQCDLFSLMRRLSGALSPLRVAWIDGQTRMSTWTKIATGALDESVGDDRAVTRNALFRLLPVLPRCIVYRDEDFGCPLELLHKKIGDVLTVKIYTGARASTNEFAPSAVLPLVHIMELSAQLEKSMIDKQPYSILDSLLKFVAGMLDHPIKCLTPRSLDHDKIKVEVDRKGEVKVGVLTDALNGADAHLLRAGAHMACKEEIHQRELIHALLEEGLYPVKMKLKVEKALEEVAHLASLDPVHDKRSDRLRHFVVDARQRALFESSCFSEIYYQQCFCADTRYVREKLIFKKPLSGEKGQYFEDSTKNKDVSIDVQEEIFEVDPCTIQFSTWIQELMIRFAEQEKLFLTPEIEAALSTRTYCMGDLTNDSLAKVAAPRGLKMVIRLFSLICASEETCRRFLLLCMNCRPAPKTGANHPGAEASSGQVFSESVAHCDPLSMLQRPFKDFCGKDSAKLGEPIAKYFCDPVSSLTEAYMATNVTRSNRHKVQVEHAVKLAIASSIVEVYHFQGNDYNLQVSTKVETINADLFSFLKKNGIPGLLNKLLPKLICDGHVAVALSHVKAKSDGRLVQCCETHANPTSSRKAMNELKTFPELVFQVFVPPLQNPRKLLDDSKCKSLSDLVVDVSMPLDEDEVLNLVGENDGNREGAAINVLFGKNGPYSSGSEQWESLLEEQMQSAEVPTQKKVRRVNKRRKCGKGDRDVQHAARKSVMGEQDNDGPDLLSDVNGDDCSFVYPLDGPHSNPDHESVQGTGEEDELSGLFHDAFSDDDDNADVGNSLQSSKADDDDIIDQSFVVEIAANILQSFEKASIRFDDDDGQAGLFVSKTTPNADELAPNRYAVAGNTRKLYTHVAAVVSLVASLRITSYLLAFIANNLPRSWVYSVFPFLYVPLFFMPFRVTASTSVGDGPDSRSQNKKRLSLQTLSWIAFPVCYVVPDCFLPLACCLVLVIGAVVIGAVVIGTLLIGTVRVLMLSTPKNITKSRDDGLAELFVPEMTQNDDDRAPIRYAVEGNAWELYGAQVAAVVSLVTLFLIAPCRDISDVFSCWNGIASRAQESAGRLVFMANNPPQSSWLYSVFPSLYVVPNSWLPLAYCLVVVSGAIVILTVHLLTVYLLTVHLLKVAPRKITFMTSAVTEPNSEDGSSLAHSSTQSLVSTVSQDDVENLTADLFEVSKKPLQPYTSLMAASTIASSETCALGSRKSDVLDDVLLVNSERVPLYLTGPRMYRRRTSLKQSNLKQPAVRLPVSI